LDEKDITEIVSNFVKITAERSPTFFGENIEIVLLDHAEREMLAEEMFQLSDEFKDELYSLEGDFIESSDKIVLIGLEDHPPFDIDCKACGYETCEDYQEAEEKVDIFEGPNCVFAILDLGVVIGHAWNTIENYRLRPDISVKAGLAAKHLGLIESRVSLAVTINIGSGKSHPEA